MTAKPEDISKALRNFLRNALEREVEITDVRRVFGGNARQAWAFELSEQADEPTAAILLSQVAGGHVDSDTSSEYAILKAMTGHGLCAPAAIALDESGAVTGAPALIMERIGGTADVLSFLNADSSSRSAALTEQLAIAAADLHGFNWRNAGLSSPQGNAALQQINDWEGRYLQSRLGPHPALTYLFGWLKDNLPDESANSENLSLVHGDLRPGNFLYEGDDLTALLDWEMAHIGDPAEDIAWIYRALWSPEKFLTLEEFLQIYEARIGRAICRRRMTYYRIFSEVKFATLSVVASASFANGKTDNFRLADRASKIGACLDHSFQWIEWLNTDQGACDE